MDNKRTITLRRSNRVSRSISYTEDNIAVYNLTIEKLPNNVQHRQVKRHFSKFGLIKDIHIKYGKTRSTPAQCIIKYQNVEGASAALKQRIHKVNGQRIIVKACPSWEQPFEIECRSMDYYMSLVLLNDYCLEEIFKKLDLRQQIRLSLCHSRLEHVFMHMICPRLPRHLDMEQLLNYSAWELRQFFYTGGLYLESLVVGPRYPSYSTELSICTFMQENSLRIKRFHIISQRRWNLYYDFLNALPLDYITELELYMCGVIDSDLKLLRKLSNLRALGLAFNEQITGKDLRLFRKLERLSICGCESVTDEYLLCCCQYLQLNYLDIRLTGGIQHPEKYIFYCETLDSLKISGLNAADPKNIVKLPKLKSLEVLHFNSAMASTFYSTLADYHADDLVELKLTGQTYIVFPSVATTIARFRNLHTLWLGDHEYNVTKELILKISNLSELEELSLHCSTRIRDRHLLPLIRKCTKLKRINLCMCRNITKNLIWNTLGILQQRIAATKMPALKEKPNATLTEQPLVMLVHGTYIRRDILQSATYQKNQHLLKLLFHSDKPPMGLTNEVTAFDITNSAINCNASEDSDAYIDSDTDYEDEESSSDEEQNVLYIF